MSVIHDRWKVLELRNRFSDADYFILLDDDEWVHTDRLASFLRDADAAGPDHPAHGGSGGSGGGSFESGSAFGGMDSFQRPLQSLHPGERWMMGSPNRQSLLLGGIIVLSRGLLQVLSPHRMIECISKHAFISTKRRVSPAVPGVTFYSEGKAWCMKFFEAERRFPPLRQAIAVLRDCDAAPRRVRGRFRSRCGSPVLCLHEEIDPESPGMHARLGIPRAYIQRRCSPSPDTATTSTTTCSARARSHTAGSWSRTLASSSPSTPRRFCSLTTPRHGTRRIKKKKKKKDRPNTTLPCRTVQGCELQSGGIVVAPGGEDRVASYWNKKVSL